MVQACMQQNPHVNHDAEATRAAKIAVKDVLRAVFKID